MIRLRDRILGNAPQRLSVLGMTALLVLVLACVNVAGLAVVRLTTRSRELAVRAALGAGRLHVIRLLGFESLVIALAGASLHPSGSRRIRDSATWVTSSQKMGWGRYVLDSQRGIWSP